MSRYHFSRIFAKKTGFSFKQYLNRKRIEAAKALMRGKGLNVSETGLAVGFNDVSYFSRLFRKVEGITPTRFRKKLYELQ